MDSIAWESCESTCIMDEDEEQPPTKKTCYDFSKDTDNNDMTTDPTSYKIAPLNVYHSLTRFDSVSSDDFSITNEIVDNISDADTDSLFYDEPDMETIKIAHFIIDELFNNVFCTDRELSCVPNQTVITANHGLNYKDPEIIKIIPMNQLPSYDVSYESSDLHEPENCLFIDNVEPSLITDQPKPEPIEEDGGHRKNDDKFKYVQGFPKASMTPTDIRQSVNLEAWIEDLVVANIADVEKNKSIIHGNTHSENFIDVNIDEISLADCGADIATNTSPFHSSTSELAKVITGCSSLSYPDEEPPLLFNAIENDHLSNWSVKSGMPATTTGKNDSQMEQNNAGVYVISLEKNKVPVISSDQNKVSVIPLDQNEVSVISSNQNEVPVISSDENKVPVISSDQNEVPVISSDQNEVPVISSDQNEVPVVSSDQNEVPVISSDGDKVPVAEQNKLGLHTIQLAHVDLSVIQKNQTNVSLFPSDQKDVHAEQTDIQTIPKQQTDIQTIPKEVTDIQNIPKQQTDIQILPTEQNILPVSSFKQLKEPPAIPLCIESALESEAKDLEINCQALQTGIPSLASQSCIKRVDKGLSIPTAMPEFSVPQTQLPPTEQVRETAMPEFSVPQTQLPPTEQVRETAMPEFSVPQTQLPPTEQVREELELISTDPAENSDNFHASWEARRILDNDADRYRDIRKRWRNLSIPEANKDLTYRHYRKPTTDIHPNYRQQQSRRQHRGRSHARHHSYTSYFEAATGIVNNRFDQEKQDVIDRHQLEVNHLLMMQIRDLEIPFTRRDDFSVNSIIIRHNEALTHLNQSHQYKVQWLECRRNQALQEYRQYMEEVRTFYSFYSGNREDAATIETLGPAELQHLEETERMYTAFSSFYDSN